MIRNWSAYWQDIIGGHPSIYCAFSSDIGSEMFRNRALCTQSKPHSHPHHQHQDTTTTTSCGPLVGGVHRIQRNWLKNDDRLGFSLLFLFFSFVFSPWISATPQSSVSNSLLVSSDPRLVCQPAPTDLQNYYYFYYYYYSFFPRLWFSMSTDQQQPKAQPCRMCARTMMKKLLLLLLLYPSTASTFLAGHLG